jgi:hypothetical protein
MSEKLIEGMKDDGEIDRLEMHIRDLKTDSDSLFKSMESAHTKIKIHDLMIKAIPK